MRPPYDVNNFLLKENGLDFIYEHFGKMKFKGKGHEISDLKRLIKRYQEWAFIMYPSMNFKDIIKKTQTFSSKNQVKNYLQTLRDKRDGVGIDDDEDDEDEDIDLNMNANNNNNNDNNNENVQNEMNVNANNINNRNNGNNNNNNNSGNGGQRRLQRQPDQDFEAVLQARGNRENDGGNNQNANNQNGNNQSGNNQQQGNPNNGPGNGMDFGMDWGTDPLDMMDMAVDDHDIEIANLMYG